MKYYLFKEIQLSGEPRYPYLAAMGILLTLVCLPLTYGIRYVLEKFGYKEK